MLIPRHIKYLGRQVESPVTRTRDDPVLEPGAGLVSDVLLTFRCPN